MFLLRKQIKRNVLAMHACMTSDDAMVGHSKLKVGIGFIGIYQYLPWKFQIPYVCQERVP